MPFRLLLCAMLAAPAVRADFAHNRRPRLFPRPTAPAANRTWGDCDTGDDEDAPSGNGATATQRLRRVSGLHGSSGESCESAVFDLKVKIRALVDEAGAHNDQPARHFSFEVKPPLDRITADTPGCCWDDHHRLRTNALLVEIKAIPKSSLSRFHVQCEKEGGRLLRVGRDPQPGRVIFSVTDPDAGTVFDCVVP